MPGILCKHSFFDTLSIVPDLNILQLIVLDLFFNSHLSGFDIANIKVLLLIVFENDAVCYSRSCSEVLQCSSRLVCRRSFMGF